MEYRFDGMWHFTVYTYFGRTLKRFPISGHQTHHTALSEAICFLGQQSQKCWLRLDKY